MTAREVIVLVLGWAGTLFIVIAGIGVIRMPDLFTRLQASAKAPTLGVGLLVIALGVHVGDVSVWWRAIALGGLLLLTAPVAAHLIARAGFVSPAVQEEVVVDETSDDDRPPAG